MAGDMNDRWRRGQDSSGRLLALPAIAVMATLVMVLASCGASGKNSASAPTAAIPSTTAATTSLPDTTTTSTTPTTVASSTTVAPAPTLPPPPATSPPPAPTAPPAGREVYGLDAFQLPSGNIQCIVVDDYVGCEIGNRTWDPPPYPDDCEGEWGDRVEMEATSPPGFACHGDTVRGNYPVLGYGTTAVAGPFRCASAKSGLTCTRNDGRGFSLARGSYRIF